ncbi:MAG: 16S rRNA (guanine(527)-N(7))-methyltransferase RsmG [Gammaproteobacteria bacterium]
MTRQLLDELNTGITALGLELPAGVPEKLIDYIGLLIHWNRAYNLTAIHDPVEMLSKHLLDSLAVLPHLDAAQSMIDVGTGAGLPGIPLALCRPEMRIVLNDSVGKKTRFLTQAKLALGLDNVEVVNRRIEEYRPTKDGRAIYFDLVIARAWAASDIIVANTRHLHHANTRILVMQGRRDEALSVAGYHVKRSHTLNIPGLAAERHLLEITQTH